MISCKPPSSNTIEWILDFILTLNDNEKDQINQLWRIEVLHPKKNYISYEYTDFIEIKNDHPLLWEFTDIQCELYFTGHCEDKAKLFYDLYMTHKQVFGNYQCFNIWLGSGKDHSNSLPYSSGLLTQGSQILMERYAACLKQNGLDYTIIGKRQPVYWDGAQFLPEKKVNILLFEQAFIIAEGFSFIQIKE